MSAIYRNIQAYYISRPQGDTEISDPKNAYYLWDFASFAPPISAESTLLAAFITVRWFGTKTNPHVDVENGQVTVALGESGASVPLNPVPKNPPLLQCSVLFHLDGSSLEIQYSKECQQDNQYGTKNGIALHIEGVVLFFTPPN